MVGICYDGRLWRVSIRRRSSDATPSPEVSAWWDGWKDREIEMDFFLSQVKETNTSQVEVVKIDAFDMMMVS